MLTARMRREEPALENQIQLTSIDVIASTLEPVVPSISRLSSPDGAVTLMLSDIADAQAATARLGIERWERLLRDHHLLVEQIVSRHDGRVMKFEGDGFLASFNSAHAGLHAAIELHRTFAADAAGEGLSIRIGLHSGFVIADPAQMLGRNMVLAARVAATARGGEILVSSTLKQYTEGDPRFTFERRGEFHFKGLLGEHVVYSTLWH